MTRTHSQSNGQVAVQKKADRQSTAPGKRNRTQGLSGRSGASSSGSGAGMAGAPVQQKTSGAAGGSESYSAMTDSWMDVAVRPDLHAPVQRHGDDAGQETSDVHEAAAHGLEGAGGSLPHQDTIQQAFGDHDVSGVSAHVGGAAKEANEAMGAQAYATGDSVAFKDTPDLHTAAHEAAHVVQQRNGVSLSGGVGQEGDQYEKHADAVANRVVAGESAADLLSSGPGGGGSAAVQAKPVQAKPVQAKKDGAGAKQESGASPSGASAGPKMQSLQFAGRDNAGQNVQFDGDDSAPAAPSGDQQAAPAEGADQGVGFQSGEYTQVQLQARIPTPIAGLTVDVTLTGKYTQGQERGVDFIEAEGVARVALSYHLLFLDLSVFLQGGLKFKVQNTQDWQTAFNLAFEDISHWVAARELANLPAKKLEVASKYDEFNTSVISNIADVRRQSPEDRAEELGRESRPMFWFNSALANLVDARNSLVSGVRDIFADVEGTINGNQIYPGTTWINEQIQPHLEGGSVTSASLNTIRDRLIQEANTRKGQVSTEMNNIPAIANNPNVEFEGNLQVGASVGLSITENTSASIELAGGWRISDSMGSQQFDTNVQNVYTAAMQVSGQIAGTNVTGQLAYEGVGRSPTDPDTWKVTGQIMAGIQAQDEDPSAYSSNLAGVKDRVVGAFRGSQIGGQSALTAVGTALKREMGANQSARWSRAGSYMAGFDAEFKFKKAQNGSGYEADGGALKFVVVRSVGGSLGVFSGSIERGNYVGIQW